MPYEVIQALKTQYGYHAGYETRGDEYWAVKRAIEALVCEHGMVADHEMSGSKLIMVRSMSQWDTYRNEFGAVVRSSVGGHELHFYAHTHAMLQKLVRCVRETGIKLARKWD